MKNTIIIIVTIFSLSGLISCGLLNGVSGKFVPADKDSMIESIEFKNGKAHVIDSFMHAEQAAPFEVEGDTLYINDPKGTIPFKIIDSKTLECSYPFMRGIYVKQ